MRSRQPPKSNSSEAKCKDGIHLSNSNHTRDQCFELHPEEKIKYEKRRDKRRAKAKKASKRRSSDTSSEDAWRCVVRKAHSKSLPANTAYLDSGASHHMISDRSAFSTYSEEKRCTIELADGKTTKSAGIGHVYVKTLTGSSVKLECLHVPELVGNLISMGRLYRKGCLMLPSRSEDKYTIVKKDEDIFKVKLNDHDVFLIRIEIVSGKSHHSSRLTFPNTSDIINLHRRAGHPSNESLRKMYDLPAFSISCEECHLSKSHRLPYSNSLPKSSHVLEFVHMDLSGRISPSTNDGYEYYFKITDQFSSYKFVYLLKKKSEAFSCFQQYYATVTVSQGRPIKNVVTDGGGEFNSNEFKQFLSDKGVTVHISAPYTPQQNPVAERGNRTTTEKARTLLKQAKLSHSLWGHALSRLRPFGCRAFVNVIKANRTAKFSDTAKKGIMVGYQLGMHNWRILTEEGRVELSHDVKFDEAQYPGISTSRPAGFLDPPLIEDMEESSSEVELMGSPSPVNVDMSQSPSEEQPPPSSDTSSDSEDKSDYHLAENSNPSSSYNSRPKPGFDYVLQPVDQQAPKNISSSIDESNIITTRRRAHTAIVDDDIDFHIQCFHAGVQFFDQTSVAPKTYSKAMKDPDKDSWVEAINAELFAMERLGVWEIVDIPKNHELLNTVWIFRKKYDQNGVLSKFKARLCAAGNFQVEGENYAETYAPTGRPTALRSLLAMGHSNGLQIHQMDVKNAFLNGKLEDTIYLRAPAGLTIPHGKCLHLLKSIYGLKQAPRVWYHELSSFFTSANFSPSDADPCLFVSNDANWKCWVHVYVDDMVIVSRDVNHFKELISSRYLMDDLGPMKHLLGMKIEPSGSGLKLSQDVYTKKILDKFGMSECKSVLTPMVPNTRLSKATPEEISKFRVLGINYRQAIGLLNYLAVSTRPDISFVMSQLSQHLENPGIQHWAACVHLLRYLSGSVSRGITLGGSIEPLKVYADADYANEKEDAFSYVGYLAMLGDSLISWKSKKHKESVSSSTTEAEYTAMYEGAREAVWLERLLRSLDIPPQNPIPILADNQAAIQLSKNTVFHDRTKHFKVHLHWIRKAITDNEVNPVYVQTNNNLADFLTKSLANPKHLTCIKGLFLHHLSVSFFHHSYDLSHFFIIVVRLVFVGVVVSHGCGLTSRGGLSQIPLGIYRSIRKAEIAFRQAYEQAKQLVPSGTLDWFKASAIALRWADALERTARLSQAVQVYELVLDDLRRALPSLTVPERVRTIQIAQKLAQLYPSLPLTASRTERTTEAAVDKKVEDWLTFCVHEILKIQRDTSNSPSTPSLYLQETIDSPDQLLLALPAWLETVQFASCFEALGKFYARRAQIDLALPLYLQTLSLLLPPPAAGTTARVASDDERCQAATVMNNIGQLLFARSETEAPTGAEQLRANAVTWLAQAAGLARRVLTDHHQPFPPVDPQLPTASSSSVSASEVAALAECRQAFRAASANLASIGGSHPPASPSSHSPPAHHAPLSDLTSSPQRPSP
ncbi:hypothetical protein PCANC_21880 [Puccinia coronata f. sp. avenae]|uniref:Integrase catalytic domain-containing protein n=1 Tax=Puccinia coronata f. sp. avenae TaxID=200324 RepID=A0A2N5S6A1_9BASI|nr:hypothetical protein PCANC_21880 [Puccinia coronata f. sp. avenae]